MKAQPPEEAPQSRRSSARSINSVRDDPYIANQTFEELRSRVRHWIGMEEPRPYVPPTAAEFQMYKERLRLKAKQDKTKSSSSSSHISAREVTNVEANEKIDHGSLPSDEVESEYDSSEDSDSSSNNVLYLRGDSQDMSSCAKEGYTTKLPAVPMLKLSKLQMNSPSVGSDFDYEFSDTDSSGQDGECVCESEDESRSKEENRQGAANDRSKGMEDRGRNRKGGTRPIIDGKNGKSARRRKHLSPGTQFHMKSSILSSRRFKKLDDLSPNDPSLLLFMPLHPLWSHSRDSLKKSNLAHFITPRGDQPTQPRHLAPRSPNSRAPRTRRLRPHMPLTDRPNTDRSISAPSNYPTIGRSTTGVNSARPAPRSPDSSPNKGAQNQPGANLQSQLATFISMPLPLVLPIPKSPKHRTSISHRPSVFNTQTSAQKDSTLEKSPRGQVHNILSQGVSVVPIPKPPGDARPNTDSARRIKAHHADKSKRFSGAMSRSGSEMGRGLSSGRGRQDTQTDGYGQQGTGANGMRRHSSDLSMVLNMDYSEPQDFTGQMEALQTATSLSSGLPPQVLDEISHNMALRRFSRAEKIVWQGAVLDGVYIIRRGSVALFKRIDIGLDVESDTADKRSRLARVKDIRVVKVATFGPGDFFGEHDLLTNPNGSFSFTAQAVEDDVEVYQWNRQSFLQVARLRDKELQKRLRPLWSKLPSDQQLYRNYMENLASQEADEEDDDTDGDEVAATPEQEPYSVSSPMKSHIATAHSSVPSTPLPSALRKPTSPSKNLRISIAKVE